MNASATLKPYTAWAGPDPGEGAALVFAHDCRQAKRLAFGTISSWGGARYIDIRVRRERENVEWMQRLADPEALAAGRAHVVESPAACDLCDTWGTPLLPEGICTRCDAASRAGALEVH